MNDYKIIALCARLLSDDMQGDDSNNSEIMHELIERIAVHALDKLIGHRVQQIDIYYRFNIAVSTAIADCREYDKKRKAA